MDVYVDDFRQGVTSFQLGLRYRGEAGEWEWKEEAYHEDLEMRKNGENRDKRMSRLYLPVMYSLNKDLKFTSETSGEFSNGRLHTLDF